MNPASEIDSQLSEFLEKPPSFKNDAYRRARGGTAAFLTLFCNYCDSWLLLYQKDGKGSLIRCYLNRIFAPSYLQALQNNPSLKSTSDMSTLKCRKCHELIGLPFRHHDGRLSFRLIPGSFKKRKGIVMG